MSQIWLTSNNGTPRVSHSCSPLKASSRSWISRVVSSTPRAFLWQWVASSFLVMWQIAPLFFSSQPLACLSFSSSSLLHSKIYRDRRPRKTPYIGWDTLQPAASHLMKCQISGHIFNSDPCVKISLTLRTSQQSWST